MNFKSREKASSTLACNLTSNLWIHICEVESAVCLSRCGGKMIKRVFGVPPEIYCEKTSRRPEDWFMITEDLLFNSYPVSDYPVSRDSFSIMLSVFISVFAVIFHLSFQSFFLHIDEELWKHCFEHH
jgi:hypothetical protein